jgi:hypothetical protein
MKRNDKMIHVLTQLCVENDRIAERGNFLIAKNLQQGLVSMATTVNTTLFRASGRGLVGSAVQCFHFDDVQLPKVLKVEGQLSYGSLGAGVASIDVSCVARVNQVGRSIFDRR